MGFTTLKALHLLGVFAWMAGLVGLGLVLPTSRPEDREHPLLRVVVQRLLYGCLLPGLAVAVTAGVASFLLRIDVLSRLLWMHGKLGAALLAAAASLMVGWWTIVWLHIPEQTPPRGRLRAALWLVFLLALASLFFVLYRQPGRVG